MMKRIKRYCGVYDGSRNTINNEVWKLKPRSDFKKVPSKKMLLPLWDVIA